MEAPIDPEVIWEGQIGSIPLRVEVPHAGKIVAQWESPNGRRNKVSRSVEEFEKTVLFQLLVSAGETSTDAVQEVLGAVALAEAERPAKPRAETTTRRKKPKPHHHRRSRRPSRRR